MCHIFNRSSKLSGQLREAGYLLIGAALSGLVGAPLAAAAALDFFGPPPAGDPSALTGPFIGLNFAQTLLAKLPPANDGAFLGGPTGTFKDAGVNNAVPAAQQTNANVPTNGKPSPLFGARSFTQQLLLFEEFGRDPLDQNAPAPADTFPMPTAGPAPELDPIVAASAPAGVTLEAFLTQAGIAPFPTQFSNTMALNPWKTEIEAFLARPLKAPPAEGRPTGLGWAHQRWHEFFPQVLKGRPGGSRSGSMRICRSRTIRPSGPLTGLSPPSCSWRAMEKRS